MLTQKSAEERFSLKDGTLSQLKDKLKLVESLVTVVAVLRRVRGWVILFAHILRALDLKN